jgi:hypothetical protein
MTVDSPNALPDEKLRPSIEAVSGRCNGVKAICRDFALARFLKTATG